MPEVLQTSSNLDFANTNLLTSSKCVFSFIAIKLSNRCTQSSLISKKATEKWPQEPQDYKNTADKFQCLDH